MHILLENIMKELLLLWEGKYKAAMVTGAADGRLAEDYVISKGDWDTIDREVSQSNKTIPAKMSRRLGSISKRGYWTAESYSYFLVHLGPIVLQNRLNKRYYEHFIRLSALSSKLIDLEMDNETLGELRTGLVTWVEDFEK